MLKCYKVLDWIWNPMHCTHNGLWWYWFASLQIHWQSLMLLHLILWRRELGKTAALVSNLCQNASDPEWWLNWLVYLAKTKLNVNPTVAHNLITSRIQRIYLMITKHGQNGSSKGISTLLMMAVSGVSKTNGPERLVWADLHEITQGLGFQK